VRRSRTECNKNEYDDIVDDELFLRMREKTLVVRDHAASSDRGVSAWEEKCGAVLNGPARRRVLNINITL